MTKKNKHEKKNKPTDNTEQSSFAISSKILKMAEYKHLGLVIACVYTAIIAVIGLSFHKIGDYGVETDFYWDYVPAAQQFLNGVIQIDQFRGPFYPMILAIFGSAFADFFVGGVMLAIISSGIVIYFSFATLKNIFSSKVAFFTTLLLITNPIFIQYTYSAGTDMFFVALVSTSMFFFFKNRQLKATNIIIAAFFSGLSYLTRYNGVFLIGFVIVIIFINHNKNSFKKRLVLSGLFAVVLFLTILPWGMYCLQQKESFFYNENYKNIAYELFGKGKMGWDDFWFKESKSFTSISQVILRDPGLFASNTIKNIPDHFLSDMEKLIGWHIGLFVVIGFILLLFNKPIKKINTAKFAYLLVNFSFFALLLVLFYGERFSMFLIPFYSSIAVIVFANRNNKIINRIPSALISIILVILISISTVKAYNINSDIISSGPKEILVIRDWFMKNVQLSQGEIKISARKAHIAYYLNMKFKPLPLEKNYDIFIDALKKDKVEYLYFSQIEAQMRPEFFSLLDPESKHAGITPLVFTNYPPAVLYKIDK